MVSRIEQSNSVELYLYLPIIAIVLLINSSNQVKSQYFSSLACPIQSMLNDPSRSTSIT